MARELLIGSGNPDKARELQLLLKDSSWEVKSLNEFPEIEEPEENESTFEGNALLKARYYSDAMNMACVADDSGLEVFELNNEPGIYSARYAGLACSYEDNNIKLLSELAGCPIEKRKARFICCAAFVDLENSEFVTRGIVDGHITEELRGVNGFGYDPLFIPEGYTLTFGEMLPEEKHKISHRARSFSLMSDWLKKH